MVSTWKAKAEESQVQDQPEIYSETLLQKKLKKNKKPKYVKYKYFQMENIFK
jgi:hypothetical protein